MFVKLIEGHEPFAVNPEQVCAVEGTSGGRDCTIIMTNGGTKRIGLPADEVLRRLSQARSDDWLTADSGKRKEQRK